VIYGLYLSSGGAKVESIRQDVLAQNLANADTVSFKRQLAVFRQRLAEAREDGRPRTASVPVLDRMGGGVWVAGTHLDMSQGPIRATGSMMDVALQGRGFLVVSGPNGPQLTRDGRLAVDDDGRLTAAGKPLLDEQATPIRVRPGEALSISAEGQVRQNGKLVGELQMVDFARPDQLRPLGKGVYAFPTDQPPRPAPCRLRQNCLEESAVQPLTELVAMMESYRAFETNLNMIRLQDATLGRLVNDVPRTAGA